MNEGISNINSATPGYYNPRVRLDLAKNLNLVNETTLADTDGGFVSNQDISRIARDLANKFGISDSVAFRVVRKFLTAGNVPKLKALEDYVRVQIGEETISASKTNAKKETDRTSQNQIAKADEEVNQASLRPLLKEIKVNLNRDKNAQIKNEVDNLFARKADANIQRIPNSRIPVTNLVSSPQAFASWLVNNKAAFIALKANPQATYLLTAMQNPILMQSPILVSELAKLIAQLMKLKQGKSGIEEIDEDAAEKTKLVDGTYKDVERVGGVSGTAESTEVNPLKDFLLEAERFAEEEVANLWSLALKKEREIEKKLKAGLKSINKRKK